MDIVFVLDASESMDKNIFRDKLCKYVADAVEKFGSNKDIRTGVVVYSSSVGTTIPLDHEEKSPELVQRIRDLPHIGYTADTAAAIQTAKELLSDCSRIKVMAVFTDGASDNAKETFEKATAAKKAGIRIYAIGIGVGASQTEIREIASFPNTRYAHCMDSFLSAKFVEDAEKLLQGLSYPYKPKAYPMEKRNIFEVYGTVQEEKMKKEPICGSYKMTAETHGVALIINNYNFNNNLKSLPGYQLDEEYLIETFRYLGYDIIAVRNLEGLDMQELMEKVASEYNKEENKSYDSFVCCILSHGERGLVNDCTGSSVYIANLYEYVEGDNCEGLVGKPKMFFFQACRGRKIAKAVKERTAAVPHLTIDSKVPTLSDFFFSYATFSGDKAFVTDGGSRYVIELCEALILHSKYASLTEMMTLVNYRVGKHAIEYTEKSATSEEVKEGKQTPVFTSSATKEVFFF